MKSEDDCHVKVTFLGHACFLLEYPSEEPGKRGVRVLLDPVFSERCSPSKWVGPLRYTKAPCTVQELPEIDAVVISHNRKPSEFLADNAHYANPSCPQTMIVSLA